MLWHGPDDKCRVKKIRSARHGGDIGGKPESFFHVLLISFVNAPLSGLFRFFVTVRMLLFLFLFILLGSEDAVGVISFW
jgi:hypothetical protein